MTTEHAVARALARVEIRQEMTEVFDPVTRTASMKIAGVLHTSDDLLEIVDMLCLEIEPVMKHRKAKARSMIEVAVICATAVHEGQATKLKVMIAVQAATIVLAAIALVF
jgi:hypothetical protein